MTLTKLVAPFFFVTSILIVLKLGGVIAWPWVWVTASLWAPLFVGGAMLSLASWSSSFQAKLDAERRANAALARRRYRQR